MAGNMTKASHPEYIAAQPIPQKRSGSGKVKRNTFTKDVLLKERSFNSKDAEKELKFSFNSHKVTTKSKSQKPKSGRNISRNNKNVGIYTMAPVMNMSYKKY